MHPHRRHGPLAYKVTLTYVFVQILRPEPFSEWFCHIITSVIFIIMTKVVIFFENNKKKDENSCRKEI